MLEKKMLEKLKDGPRFPLDLLDEINAHNPPTPRWLNLWSTKYSLYSFLGAIGRLKRQELIEPIRTNEYFFPGVYKKKLQIINPDKEI